VTKRILLDTDILVDFFHNQKYAKDLLTEFLLKGNLYISILSVAELRTGFTSQQASLLLPKLYKTVVIVNLSLEIAELAGKFRFEYRSQGISLPTVDTLIAANCQIIAVKGIDGYSTPPVLHNDGYGAQQTVTPDILAFDPQSKEFIVGIARVTREELESEKSLTEYDVLFDQKDKDGKPYRVVIIAPAKYASEVTSVVTHYIHRELWHVLTIVASKKM